MWPDQMVYFELIRDIWEAVVIYSFLNLMLEYCGGENSCLSVIMNEPGSVSHFCPLNLCFSVLPLDATFLRYCKQATIQFVIVKPLMAVINLILISQPDDRINRKVQDISMNVVYNISYTVALYYLALFYKAIHHHPGIVSKRPLAKFAAVKMVVFLTYYQFLIFTFVPVFEETGPQWNSFILCCEMAIFSVLHFFAFNWSEYANQGGKLAKTSMQQGSAFAASERDREKDIALENAKDVMSISDVAKDAYYNFNMKYGSHVMLDTEASSVESASGAKDVEMVEKDSRKANIFGKLSTTLRSIKTGGKVGDDSIPSSQENPFGNVQSGNVGSSDNPFVADNSNPFETNISPTGKATSDLDLI